jgi:uncharacterized protein
MNSLAHGGERLSPEPFTAGDALHLLDWKRRIFAVYAEVRAAADPERAWRRWRAVREELYRAHPQSPLPGRARRDYRDAFFPYDSSYRVLAEVEDAAPEPSPLPASIGGTFAFSRVGMARFMLDGREHELELHWNEGYGNGLLLAVADETNGEQTYAGGRYVLDTVKGADLGAARRRLVVDFNFAFNPSCAFDARWSCPLPPPANRLPVRLQAGERAPAWRDTD